VEDASGVVEDFEGATGLVAHGAHIFVVDADGIYRAGMVGCLGALPEVEHVTGCASLEEALSHPSVDDCALAIVSVDSDDHERSISRVLQTLGCSVLATATQLQEPRVRAAVEAGAVGVMSKTNLSTESLIVQVRAALHGAGIVPAALLPGLLSKPGAGRPAAGLNDREQGVLRLLADGRMIRDVADELCFSERTVKSVVRDAVAKLGARNRSQAIATAVREGLI
jgi:DNA-binding NarL/FixJ family response regulator